MTLKVNAIAPPPPKRLLATLAAALMATMVAAPVWAAAQNGAGACRPEAGDLRATRWTSQDVSGCVFPNCVVQTRTTGNSVDVTIDLNHSYDFGGQYVVPPDTPKLVNVAVMGNDAKAGTVVWGQRVGELDGSNGILTGGSVTRTFGGLKYNAHYVAVLYSPYLGFGNLRPFTRHCFRTGPDPDPVTQHTGCFAHPTLGFAACIAARNACNNDSSTNWDNDRNQCRPASN